MFIKRNKVRQEARVKKEETSNKMGCNFKAFMECKPMEFSGREDPITAMTWMTHIEKSFRTRKCAEKR